MKESVKTCYPRILIYCGLNKADSFRKIFRKYDLCFAFEANPDFFAAGLYDEFKEFENIRIIHAALTTFDGEIAFNVFNNDAASSVGTMSAEYVSEKKSRFEFKIDRKVNVPAINLLNFCRAHHIDYIEDYISDLQGLDFEVLNTMKPFIEQGKIKNIQCEVAKMNNVYNLPANNIKNFEDLLSRYYHKIAEGDGLLDHGFKPVPEDYWTFDVKWTVKTRSHEQPRSYSQLEQDKILDHALFSSKEGGVFVEVGATDGYHFSNTLFFEKWRGWRGICIEPNPIEFEKLKNSSRTCIKENYAISDKEGETEFLAIDGYGKGLSGMISSYDPKHLKRIEQELKGHDSTRHIYKVKTIPLQKLLDRHQITYVDYCSIDVEGAEMQVLQSIDYDKTYIECFTIENNYGLERETKYLKSKGYSLWKRVGWDDFFVKSDAFPLMNRQKAQKDLILKLINAHHAAFLPLDQPVVIEEVNPLDLVTWMRFDVVAKYIYARHRELGIDSRWGYHLYYAHEQAFNNCNEKDGSGKKGINAFIEEFHKILDSIRESGFDSSKSAIPVSYTNNLIDGSHRVAACLCYNRPLTVLRFHFEGWHYPYDFFRQRGLAEVYCDAIALEYCRLKKNTHMVLLFPSAIGRDREVREILREYTSISYEKSIQLLNDAPLLLMTQVYREESWLGDLKSGYPGAALKARECFRGTGPLRVFIIETDQPEKLKEVKDRIRAIYNISNHSVHINDTHRETVLLSQILLNNNSILFMNRSNLAYLSRFRKNYERYAAILSEVDDRERFCVTASAVLALHGLRDARDIDYLHFGEALPKEKDISSHNTEMKHYPCSADEIIFDPRNHFYFDGLKFASLDIVKRMKEMRDEEKDRKDRELIRQAEERGEVDSNSRGEAKQIIPQTVITAANQVSAGAGRMRPLLSIIILNYNGLRHLKPCLAKIRKNTPEDHEIIVFDNASNDGSIEFLKTQPYVILMASGSNIGCPPGRARALSAARGEFVVLLDNDTVVTSGWSTRFLAHARRVPELGIIGPRSNYVSGSQLVQGVPYKNFDELEAFAVEWGAKHEGELLSAHRLVGFCMFIRRAVIEKIGNIDQSFGKFGFEDDDFTWRAIIAGFKVAVANDVFIHHTGGPQGKGDPGYNQQLLEAWEVFKRKWELPNDLAYGSPYNPLPILMQVFNRDRHYIPLHTDTIFGTGTDRRTNDKSDLIEQYKNIQRLVREEPSDDAIQKLEALAKNYPDASFLFNDLGVLYGNRGENVHAEQNYRKAYEIDPENATIKKNYADFLLVVKKDMVRAVAILNEVLKKDPADIETLIILGNICLADGRLEDAGLFYRKTLQNDPVNIFAIKGLEEIGARRNEARNGIASIILMPSGNSEDQRFKCLKALQAHTSQPCEIILKKNEEVAQMLKKAKKQQLGLPNVVVVGADKKSGLIHYMNQAIASSKGEYIVFLKDDVIVTDGWLSGMREYLDRNERVGLVGPIISGIGGRQGLENEAFDNEDILNRASRDFHARNRYRAVWKWNLESLCLLFGRELSERIGLFDEDLDDRRVFEDFCLRAEMEGYRNIIAGDVLIHHCGSSGTVKHKPGRQFAALEDNKVIEEKWVCVDKKTPQGRNLLLLLVSEKADDLCRYNRLDEAVKVFIAGIKQCTDNADLYFRLAEILIKKQQFQHALSILEQMPDTGDDVRALVLKGYCEEGLEHVDRATEYARRALMQNADNAVALNLKGTLAYQAGDPSMAAEILNKAMALDPGYGEPQTNLGVIRWSEGAHEEGLKLLERGFVLSPTSHNAATLYHSALTALNAYERGEVAFKEGMSLHLHDQTNVYLLIDLLLKQGKNEVAMNMIENAMAQSASLDEGILDAALAVREKIGVKRIVEERRSALSLCMIVKNEERYLAQCLCSVRDIADEIIVVDTGSTDRTKDIARVFGARVYDFVWNDDFSAARNVSLDNAKGAWILVLDGDEVISGCDLPRLSSLLARGPARNRAYSLVTRNYVRNVVANWVENRGEYPEEQGSGWHPSVKVRVFPNSPAVRFRNPVHELVEPSLAENRIQVIQCDVPVHHYGKLDASRSVQKWEQYFKLGRKKLLDGNAEPNAIRELAIQANELGKYEDAVALWGRLIAMDPNDQQAYTNIVVSYAELRRLPEALESAKMAVALNPLKREAVYHYGLVLFYMGSYDSVIEEFEKFRKHDAEYPPVDALLALSYLLVLRKKEGLALMADLRIKRFDVSEYITIESKKLSFFGRSEEAKRLIEAATESGYASNKLSLEKTVR